MHRKILFGIIAAVVCGLFVSAPSAQAGGNVTSASRYQCNGKDYWTFYFDTSVSYSSAPYWVDAVYTGTATQTGSDSLQITVDTGSYGLINNALYLYGGTNSQPSYAIFRSDGTSYIYNQ